MKNIEEQLRHLASIKPSDAFKENARRRLMSKITHEPFWIVRLLKNIFKPSPSPLFAKAAWQNIVETISVPRISLWDQLGFILRRLLAPQFIAAILMVAFVGGIIGAIPKTDATAKTEIFVTQGVVDIKSLGEDWRRVTSKTELKIGDQIRTNAQGKAEINFPNYSVIRLSSNTKMSLPQLFDDTKPVIVQLQEGRIWSSIISQKQDVYIETKHSRVSTDYGVFDVEANDTTHVRAIQNAVQVESRETSAENIVVSAGFETEITDTASEVSLLASSDSWTKENQKKDESLREEILEKETEESKQMAGILPGHPLYEMKELMEETLNRSDEFERIQGQFAASKVLLSLGKVELANAQLEEAKEALRAFWAQPENQELNQQQVLAFLEKEKTLFLKVLSGDALFPFKKDFQELSLAYATNPSQEVLNQVADKMLEVQNFVVQEAPQAERLLVSLNEFKAQNDAVIQEAMASGEKEKIEKILDLQNQNLKLLGELSPNLQTPEVQDAAENTRKELAELIQKMMAQIAPEQKIIPRANQNYQAWLAHQVQILADKVNTYQSTHARLNTVHWILQEIEDKESNISFLMELKKAMPEDTKVAISKKILKIKQNSRK